MSDMINGRLAVCNSCQFNVEGDCAICGCDILIKVADPNEQCPAQPAKWLSETGQAAKVIADAKAGCIPCRNRNR